jgi:hypothetical protein
MLLRVLREIFYGAHPPASPPEPLPQDEYGFDQAMAAMVGQGRTREVLALYDAAVAAGFYPADAEFDAAYRRGITATGSAPFPLRRRARFHNLYRLIGEVTQLEGEVAECGCFRGLSTHLTLGRLKRANPHFDGHGFHVFDSFQGLSEPIAKDIPLGDDPASARVRRMCQRGWFAASLDSVKTGLAEFPGVSYYPGWIPQSFAGLPERRYRFVNLDVDLYEPTLGALEYFWPRLVSGAIIVSDDFGWPGARDALQGFCARNSVTLETTAFDQAILRCAR